MSNDSLFDFNPEFKTSNFKANSAVPVENPEEQASSISLHKSLTSAFSTKWQKELDLHRMIDTAIILEGNVNDEQVYEDSAGDTHISSIEAYLYEYLHSIGYQTVIFFNNIVGFYNKYNEREYKHFHSIVKKADAQEEGASDNKDEEQVFDCSAFSGESLRDMRLAMENKIEPVAIVLCDVSRYISSPNAITPTEQFFYSQLSLATKSKRNHRNSPLHNIMFLIAEKANDIPAWFYLNNPNVKTITIPEPDMHIRELFIESYYDDDFIANPVNVSNEERQRHIKQFVSYTEGFHLVDLKSLKTLMNSENLPVSMVAQAVSKFKYGIDKNPWEDEVLRQNLHDIENKLKERVKGQDTAVHKAATIIKSAVLGLSGLQHSSSKAKPRGVMFLAGPTGVGKTELAKAISEWVFQSDSHVIRFDMSEYSQSHSDQRLLGAPPGYVGYEQGGQLTEAVKKAPFSVLLFDEIEKADPSILDKFLQILEDGRMTDGKGETVYFSDCLIIFTSNLGMYKEQHTEYGIERVPTVHYGDDGCNDTDLAEATAKYDDYSKRILNAIHHFFTLKIERPEIKNRIGDNFIVFDYISRHAAMDIAKKQIYTIAKNLKEQKNISLVLTDEAFEQLFAELLKEEHLTMGGRGVGNLIENMLIRAISDHMANNCIWSNQSITVTGFVHEKGNWSITTND